MNGKEFEELKHELAMELEKFKAQQQTSLEKYKYDLDVARETFLHQWENRVQFSIKSHESTIEYSAIGIRSLLIANGAAAIALLTFIGTIVKEGERFIALLTPISYAMAYFLTGVACTLVCVFASYIAQSFYTVGAGAAHKSPEEINANKVGSRWTAFAVVAATAGFFAFAGGLYKGVNSFADFAKKELQPIQEWCAPNCDKGKE